MLPPSAHHRLNIATGFATEVGKRSDNQDFAALVLDDGPRYHGVVGAVADGLGGRKGGRVAAELAVRSFIDDYLGQSDLLSPRKTAARALESINYWLHREGQKNENLAGMACAFTGIVIKGQTMHSFHVGDTRLYRLRDGQLEQLTRDHKPDGAPDGSSFVARAVGMEESIRIEYGAHDLHPHDRVLLCSDGLHGHAGPVLISTLLDQRLSAEETARQLVQAAYAHGGDDNATALVIDVIDLPPATFEDLDAAITKLPIIEPPAVGAIIDGFRLERVLADGEYSRVFRARDIRDSRLPTVLLKFPKPDTIGAEKAARSAFTRESWVASRIQHLWIGSVLTLAPGRQTCLYIAQPYYVGETLEHRLRRVPRVSLVEGVAIATKLAKAIGSLHNAGIIHRDIKPENIILLPDGGLKLVDLGVAFIPGLDRIDSVFVPGTPSYKAPEQFEAPRGSTARHGDQRTDIFALGVTLYRMFTGGEFPFGEIAPGETPKFNRPAPLTAKRRDLPDWLNSLIMQAIAPIPEDRFQDGFEMAFKLETGQHGAEPDYFRKHSFIGRNQVPIWRTVSALLALIIVGLIMQSYYGITIQQDVDTVVQWLLWLKAEAHTLIYRK
jgi:serine/threonine protein phosphatase PrpC/serine/threonine protein kinase